MNTLWGSIMLGITGLVALLACFITLLIALDTTYMPKQYRKIMVPLIAGVSILLNFIAIICIHKVLFDGRDIRDTARELYHLSFSYQDIKFYALGLLGSIAGAGVIGFSVRWCLAKLLNKHFFRSFLTVRRKTILFLLFAVVFSIGIGAIFISFNAVDNIVINEVSGFNKTTTLDGHTVACDYIELYNNGYLDWNTWQMFLSDDANNLKKWQLPAQVIPAKGFVVLPMDTATFSIGRNGNETIYLSDELGRILDQVTLPSLESDISYCRVQDGIGSWEMRTQTPGQSNNTAKTKRNVSVSLSHAGGFYEDAFYLNLETEPGYDIYYTIDGSIPDANATRFESPIYVYDRSAEPNIYRNLQRVVLNWKDYTPYSSPVPKAFIVRAIPIAKDGTYGNVTTATYFVDLEEYKNAPVVSIIADPDDMFGEDGIYMTGIDYDTLYLSENISNSALANFMQKGRESEIPVHLEFINQENSFGQNVGLRISGASSRNTALKRFSVYARTQYSGSQTFEKDLFDGISTRRIYLRDSYANGMSQVLVADRAIATQSSIPVYLFVNGEYWRYTYILEKYDTYFFQERYGIREDNALVFKYGKESEWTAEEKGMFNAVYEYLATHDLSLPEDYAGFGELVDIQSYIDFMCANLYMNNTDFTERKNIIWWRAKDVTSGPYNDGKWRFALYDMDFITYGTVEQRIQNNIFTEPFPFVPALSQQQIYAALTTNPQFRQQFVLTFMDMVNHSFRYERVANVLDTYDPLVGTTDLYTFFQERGKYIVPYMAEAFHLTGTLETVTIDRNINGGTIQVNTITPDLTEGSWSGQYYTDYPITVTAIAEPGFRFVGWSGDVNSKEPTIEITLSAGGASINAIFEKI